MAYLFQPKHILLISKILRNFILPEKNKLIDNNDTDPILRHGHLTVKINPYVAKYKN